MRATIKAQRGRRGAFSERRLSFAAAAPVHPAPGALAKQGRSEDAHGRFPQRRLSFAAAAPVHPAQGALAKQGRSEDAQ
jgi:hypothetical protein